jgi:ankyrin repeat protein
VRALIEDEMPILHYAARYNYADVLKYLLQEGAIVDATDLVPYHLL